MRGIVGGRGAEGGSLGFHKMLCGEVSSRCVAVLLCVAWEVRPCEALPMGRVGW